MIDIETEFLYESWYVAGWSADFEQTLTPLTILNEKIVIFRTTKGDAVALEDACPHRKLPLSCGQLNDDRVACGYHGLTFDKTGRCVNAPTQPNAIPNIRVKSYPLEDRFGLLWIWMGEPTAADPDTIFHVDNYEMPLKDFHLIDTTVKSPEDSLNEINFEIVKEYLDILSIIFC